jgi:heme oxygenase (biliverdin-IX-beta and delta-forming)
MPQILLSRQSSPELFVHLRACTEAAHRSLETTLDLTAAPSHTRFAAMLKRFHGFHSAWEPALSLWPKVSAFMVSRGRLAQLHADLTWFGCEELEIAAIPPCSQAIELLTSQAAAVGSAYVLEGATLGGQVITRALGGIPWAPEHGFAYFNPYGAATGPMWRAFKAWADDLLTPDEHDAAAEGAERTFALLEQWLSS